MKDMKVLLTGASGFIGQALAAGLDHCIVPMHMRDADLRDPAAVSAFVEKVRPDAVIHLAAKTEVAWSFDDYADVSHVNYVGTVNLAEAVCRHVPDAHFVFASTMETYGRHPEPWAPFTEDTPQNPCAPYAVAKVAAEKYLAYLTEVHGLDVTILRQTNTYGRRDNDFFVVERTVTQMLRSSICRLGAAEPIRNFLWIDDLVDLYQTVIGNPAAVGQTFVTGPDNAVTIAELAALVAKKTGFKGRIEWGTQPPRPGEVWYLNSDPAKARDVLGWVPTVDLDDGLDRTIAIWSG